MQTNVFKRFTKTEVKDKKTEIIFLFFIPFGKKNKRNFYLFDPILKLIVLGSFPASETGRPFKVQTRQILFFPFLLNKTVKRG